MTAKYHRRPQPSEEKAVELLEQWRQIKPPIDVDFLADKAGVDLVYEELDDDVSGFLMKKKGKVFLAVNSHHHPNRQRFSIAHELGHYFLHLKKGAEFFIDRTVYYRNTDSSEGKYQQEIEANSFAAALLMPRQMLEDELEKYGEELTELDIYRLANRFGVSQQAMEFRLQNLGLIIIES